MKALIAPHLRLFALLLLTAATSSFAGKPIQLVAPWIAEAPPTSKVMAAYMDIENLDAEPVEINKISSDAFSSIEIHRSIEDHGVARMTRQTSIHIAGHGHFTLEPGGYHLMMFNPKKRFTTGDTIRLNFNFIKGDSAAFDVAVQKLSNPNRTGHH